MGDQRMNEDRKTFIAFDQYQRYETVARLIDYQRKEDDIHGYQILEIGANEHKNMKLFLPEDQITFTDIVLTEEMKRDSEFLQVDGTDIPFEDNSFDIVYATDVLEHIPNEKRERFISEASRVAGKLVVLTFPYQAQAVIDAEARVNAYYKAISGQDFIWLKEHEQNSLPCLNEINNILEKASYKYNFFFHGAIETWEKMWYCHFDTVFAQETLEYCRNIDHFYNCNIYIRDISDSCYRVFYVIYKTEASTLSQYIPSMWHLARPEQSSFLDVLLQTHQKIHPLYEQSKLWQALMDKEKHIQNQDFLLQQAEKQRRELIRQQEEQRLDLTQKREEVQECLILQREKVRRDLTQQCEALKQQLIQSQHDYSVISNAFFWKVTKPLRVITDIIKYAFRKL